MTSDPRPMTPDSDAIEAVARAIFRKRHNMSEESLARYPGDKDAWRAAERDEEESRWPSYRDDAQAALSTLKSLGFVRAEEGEAIVPIADYRRLWEGCNDDMLVVCETCGAWLDRDDEATASTEGYTGCWKAATGRPRDSHLCRFYRAELMRAPSPCATAQPDGIVCESAASPSHKDGE